jgi:curli production assembly/transport component CsgF
MRFFLVLVVLFIVSMQASAQDLVYRAKNPAFGGETFNYQWLLSGAQGQDTYANPALAGLSGSGSSLNSFSENLNRQLLSRLSSQIITNQFGEDDLKPGSYSVGDFQVDVSNTLEGVLIDVVDQRTGETTQLLIPFF